MSVIGIGAVSEMRTNTAAREFLQKQIDENKRALELVKKAIKAKNR